MVGLAPPIRNPPVAESFVAEKKGTESEVEERIAPA
jgi:hypothetical protein